MTFAGIPPTVISGVRMSLETTALAPIATPSAMVTAPTMAAPKPMKTLSPMVGTLLLSVAPITTPPMMRQLQPIFACWLMPILP